MNDSSTADNPSTEGTAWERGHLPQPVHRFAITPLYEEVSPRLAFAVHRGTIAAVSGPVGVGKTTAVAQVLRDREQRAVWVQMATNLSARGHMADIWRCLTGTPAVGGLQDTRDDILDYLREHEVVLAMDDAHFINPSGLRTLVSIWNDLHISRGRGVPMVLTGNGLLTKLAVVPEVLSRVGPKVRALPLHGDSLVAALTTIEPRIAHTDREMLADIDRRYLKGELRQWNEFIEAIRCQPHASESGISGKEASLALTLLGFLQPSVKAAS